MESHRHPNDQSDTKVSIEVVDEDAALNETIGKVELVGDQLVPWLRNGTYKPTNVGQVEQLHVTFVPK